MIQMRISRWLDVEVDSLDSGLNALPGGVITLDLQNDDDYKLVIGDLSKGENDTCKLKVFKGASLVTEMSLPSFPLAITGFYAHDMKPPTLPFIAVALGSAVYVYKNMKLFYKYYLPSIQVNIQEEEAWREMSENDYTNTKLKNFIQTLRAQPFSSLSWQSQDLLFLKGDMHKTFIDEFKGKILHKTSEVTCMTTLKMRLKEKFGASCLVLGTEDGNILFLDPQTFNVMNHRDSTEGQILYSTQAPIIQIEVMPTDGSTIIICTDQTMSCYTKKGKKQWTLTLDHYPITATLMSIHHLGAVFYALALKSGHIHIYNGKALVDTIFIREVVSVMKFGQLGQAEHVLMIVTMEGNLQLKILKRTAEFNAQSTFVSTTSTQVQQSKPIVIPKKSKLFVEQAIREKENAVEIHKSFQRDLNMLRLTMARILIEAHNKSENAIGIGKLENIRLSAEVEGLGPVFRVVLVVENASKKSAVSGLALLYHVNPADYKVFRPYVQVPYLVPGAKLKFPSKVEEMFTSEDGLHPDIYFRDITGQASERSIIKVLLLKDQKSVPVLAATIQMPPTDPMMLPIEKMQTCINLV